MWYAQAESAGVGRITTAGVITDYNVPGGLYGCFFEGIAAGADGSMWFSECGKVGVAVFTAADLAVSPATGSYGTSLTSSGSGFAAGEIVNIYAYGFGSSVPASPVADAAGSVTASIVAPPSSPYSPRLILAQGRTSGKRGAASFSVTPLLILTPHSGSAGSTAQIQGFGFYSSNKFSIVWDSPRTVVGTVTVNALGAFEGETALTFTIPSQAAPGIHAVTATDDGVKATAYFKVE